MAAGAHRAYIDWADVSADVKDDLATELDVAHRLIVGEQRLELRTDCACRLSRVAQRKIPDRQAGIGEAVERKSRLPIRRI